MRGAGADVGSRVEAVGSVWAMRPLAFAFFLLLAAVASAAPAATPVDTAALLRQFEPVLYFHLQEDWAPERADGFVGRARLEEQIAKGVWAAAPLPLPTSTTGCAWIVKSTFGPRLGHGMLSRKTMASAVMASELRSTMKSVID